MRSSYFKFFGGLCLLLITPAILAQEVIYKPDAPIALDAAVIYGKLDNGMTYYVRENREPKERAEFYLVVNVGATSEDPDQNGLAHFAEHMAFNGTKNFDKKAIINYLQSIGMKFGPEINAFTSSDETNYMLQKVPTTDPKIVDTALLILYDWAFNIAFEDEEIDYERGVIHEEWRTGRSAMFRMMREANKTLLRNSKYADHDVIGDIDIIDNFEYDVIRRFYNDWYRPDLLAVVAVGDFNGREIEEKITGLFSREPKAESPRERKYSKVPDHEETLITIQTDKEAQYPIVQLVYKHDPMPDRNMNYYREGIKQQLFNSMLNTRLQELIISEDPPFVYGYAFYTNLVRTKDGFMAIAVANNNELDKALNGLLTENKRIRDHGFTETELERVKNEFMRSLEKQYAEKDKMENTNYVWQYYSHFLMSEPAPGIEFDLAFSKNVVPGITLEEINEQAGKWIREENRVVVMMAPDNPDIIVPDEAMIWDILKRVEETEVEAYVDKVIDKPLVSDEPAPAKVAKKGKNKDLGTTEWTFPNGVKVVMKTTDFKDDEILLSAFSFGGTSLYEIKDLTSASFAASVVAESGLGEFDKVSLDKMLSGKIVDLRPVIGDTYEGFDGSCSVQDLETMLQMVYLYFTNPRIDDVAFNAFIKRMRAVLDNRALDPSSALMDTVAVVMANYHPRVRPMTSEMLEEASLRRIRSIFRDRFGDPGGFTFYFVGNIDPEKARPLIEKYLGGLPTVTRQETWADNGVRPPEGKVERALSREMKVPKGTVFISYSGSFDYDDYQSRLNLSSLVDILNVRYVETVREEEGGTYGVRVYESMSKYPYKNYRVTISFDCDPQNADRLKDIIYREIAILQNEGPADKDLKGVVENKLKTYQENLRRNRYWLGVLRNRDFNQSDLSEYLKYENYIRNLSHESLKAAAQQFFGDNIVEVVLLPENIEDNIANPVRRQ